MVGRVIISIALLSPCFIEIMNAPAHTTHNLLLVFLLDFFFCTNAFSFDGHALESHCQTMLHSSMSLDDEMRLPSGGFGITTTPPRAAVNARHAAAAAAEFSLQTEPSSLIPTSCELLPMSPAETVSYKDLDLPYHSLTYETDPAYETLAAVELSVSRMAMIAALGLFSVEFTTGTSVLDQVLSMIGSA